MFLARLFEPGAVFDGAAFASAVLRLCRAFIGRRTALAAVTGGTVDYVFASLLSVIPGQISLVAIGSFISNPNTVNGVIVGIAWIAVLILTIWAH